MASALASAQPAAPAEAVATTEPTALDSALPADQLRIEQLARSVDGLLAQIRAAEQAVAAGAATPTPSPTLRSGRGESSGDATTEAEPTTEAAPTSEPTTAPTAVPTHDGRGPTEDPSETPEPQEPSDD